MKTIFSFLLIALIATNASATVSNADFTMTISGQTLLLHTTRWNQSELNVQIKDEQGRTIFDKTYEPTDAVKIKRYNLAQLAEGTYRVILSNDLQIVKQNIVKKEKSLLVEPSVESHYKPQISVLGKQLKVNYLNLDRNATIKILDPNSETIYEALINQPGYNQQFNLSRLDRGAYTLLVTQGNDHFSQAFNIN